MESTSLLLLTFWSWCAVYFSAGDACSRTQTGLCLWLSVLVIVSNSVFLLLSTRRFIMAWNSRMDPKTKLKSFYTYAHSRIIGSNAVEKVEVVSHNSDRMNHLQMIEWTENPTAVDSNG